MGTLGLLRGLVVGLFICIGLIGLTATQAFAVAGKFTSLRRQSHTGIGRTCRRENGNHRTSQPGQI
jgi:hypothetical protein